jgi:hypothetical protein
MNPASARLRQQMTLNSERSGGDGNLAHCRFKQLFAKLKSFLRKMKARTVEQLWSAIASFLKEVSKEECKAYLANSGYT